MSIVPTKIEDLLMWAEVHQAVWVTVATQIGLSTAQATAFKDAWQQASSDYLDFQSARDALNAAATTSHDSIRDLRRSAADTLRFIKAYAQTQSAPAKVYAAAQIPPPSQGSPAGPPGTPFDFKAVLNPDGSIDIRWKCTNPAGTSGTVYNIRRKLSTEQAFTYVGAAGLRRFTDATIPLGTASVQYVVTAQRGSEVGIASSPFTVHFAAGGGGAMTITSQVNGPADPGALKVAA